MNDPGQPLIRRVAPALGLLLLVASFVLAADVFGSRQALFGSATPAPRESAFSRIDSSTGSAPTSVLRSQPWYQEVGRYRGTGSSADGLFRIGPSAIQWRATWTCETGRFVIRTPAEERPVIDEPCTGRTTQNATQGIGQRLQVDADGPWTLRVAQQVDVPLVEPPLPAMSAPGARTVATGSFYRIDQVGRGRMTVYRLPSGRYALRLRNFFVTANVDLEIRLHPLRKPRTTRDYLRAPAQLAAPLDVTTGSMNFVLPDGVDPRRYRSVVIWCPIVTSAYAAATLDFRQPAAEQPA